jgi:RDD family
MTSTPPSLRARFWRRFFAWTIDGCAVGAVIAAIGILLYWATDGRIRVANTVINTSMCAPGGAMPVGLDLPTDFKVHHVVRCTRTVFGIVHDQTLTVSEVTRSGPLTSTRSITFPTDAAGQPTQAFYLDTLSIFIFMLYLIVSEWGLGTTLGKDTLYMQVQPLGGGPMTAAAAVKRTLVLFIPIYPVMLAAAPVLALGRASMPVLMPYLVVAFFAFLVLAVAIGLNFILAVRRGDLPWHDRWARTEVIRTKFTVPPGQQNPPRQSDPNPG